MSKAEVKAAAKVAVSDALGIIEDALGNIARITTRYLNEVGVFEVQAGIGLSMIRDTMTAAKAEKVDLSGTVLIDGVKSASWLDVANVAVPGKSRPTLYRWTNAGTVARVLGPELTGSALIGSLVPLYRILTAAKSPEELEAAEDLVRATYRECIAAAGLDEDGEQVPPTESDVKAAAEAACPTNRSGGSTAEDSDESEDEDEDGDEDGREPASAAEETFTFTGSAEDLLNVRNTVGAFVKATATEHDIAPVLVQTIMVWTAMAAKAHGGPDAILAALSA